MKNYVIKFINNICLIFLYLWINPEILSVNKTSVKQSYFEKKLRELASHSGDLLLWVGVRRRLSCSLRRVLITRQKLTKIGL